MHAYIHTYLYLYIYIYAAVQSQISGTLSAKHGGKRCSRSMQAHRDVTLLALIMTNAVSGRPGLKLPRADTGWPFWQGLTSLTPAMLR